MPVSQAAKKVVCASALSSAESRLKAGRSGVYAGLKASSTRKRRSGRVLQQSAKPTQVRMQGFLGEAEEAA
jgi:hypothetical protein